MKRKKGILASFGAAAVLAASAGAGVAAQDNSPANPVSAPASSAAAFDAAASSSRAGHKHGNKNHGHKKHQKHKKKVPKTTIGERHLIKWAERQVGKVNFGLWLEHYCLQFTDDGMAAVGLNPLRAPSATIAWRAYKSMGRGHAWGTQMKKLKPGDLVFWDAYQGGISKDGHVGIYAGNGTVIENLGGVIGQHSVYYAANGAPPSGWVKVGNKHFIPLAEKYPPPKLADAREVKEPYVHVANAKEAKKAFLGPKRG
jgi:cell wall-associated NlpC family hydrolase